MTPKEKAEELLLKFLRIDNNTKEWFNKPMAKQCALITIEEILTIKPLWDLKDVKELNYWLKVKNQINKL